MEMPKPDSHGHPLMPGSVTPGWGLVTRFKPCPTPSDVRRSASDCGQPCRPEQALPVRMNALSVPSTQRRGPGAAIFVFRVCLFGLLPWPQKGAGLEWAHV